MLKDFITSGGPLIFPLIACSIIGFAIVLERSFYWLSFKSGFNASLVESVYMHLSQKRVTEALKSIGNSKDPSLVCVKKCLETHQEIKPLTLESLASQTLKPTRKFERALETIITIAPLLGILGTVLGIILSFQNVGSDGMGDPGAMMAGLSQALITTALGLGISIALLVFHNSFLKMSDETKDKLEEELTLFEELA
ncbi:MAG: MotA/TolQ/ExbB proton channel family protein [Bdellovibrionales bacterium]